MEDFIKFACSQLKYLSEKVIRCPCKICKNIKHFMPDEVNVHIFKKGFTPGYWYWMSHGEETLSINLHEHIHSSASTSHQGYNFHISSNSQTNILAEDFEHVNRYQGMGYDSDGIEIDHHDDKEVAAAQLHVLINYDEVKPFLKDDPIDCLRDDQADGEENDRSSFQAVVNENKCDIIEGGDEDISNKEEEGDEETSSEEANDEEKETSEVEDFFIVKIQPDSSTPIVETVRAMNYVIGKGLDFHWGTGEWSAQQITEAWGIAQRLYLVGPIVARTEYNLLSRHKLSEIDIWVQSVGGKKNGRFNDLGSLGRSVKATNNLTSTLPKEIDEMIKS
ncbi:hypothetical protein T459_08855 [Capsicum annuum]|uniref:Transposase-associated domain-containing protein n=1 Tax=Capsicum annuum TaxID=4072 RepID=A0A2G2ZXQ7_CAPAN|nr:hypothetical protein T459_08855 [Capsicum annuum]